MANILLTGGRAPAALELARIFDAAGHRVFMAESVRGHLSAPSRAIVRNFLVPTCEEIFHIARGYEVLSKYCTVFTESIERLHPLHHKYQFVCKAADYGLAVPESMLLESAEDVQRAFDRWDGLVLKPAYSR